MQFQENISRKSKCEVRQRVIAHKCSQGAVTVKSICKFLSKWNFPQVSSYVDFFYTFAFCNFCYHVLNFNCCCLHKSALHAKCFQRLYIYPSLFSHLSFHGQNLRMTWHCDSCISTEVGYTMDNWAVQGHIDKETNTHAHRHSHFTSQSLCRFSIKEKWEQLGDKCRPGKKMKPHAAKPKLES